MNPPASQPVNHSTSQPVHPPSCRVCEWHVDCRGECGGSEDGRPCPEFQRAANRAGTVDPVTGDERDPLAGPAAIVLALAFLGVSAAAAWPTSSKPIVHSLQPSSMTEADPAGVAAVSPCFPAAPGRSDCLAPGAARPEGSLVDAHTDGPRRLARNAGVSDVPAGGIPPVGSLAADRGRRQEAASPARRDALACGSRLNAFLDAVRSVETGPGPYRGQIGDQRSRWGPSRGPYQIGWAYWSDAQTGMDYARVVEDAACRRTIETYLRRWCPSALKTGDWETCARWHNGGPGAWRSNKAAAYARRVIARMEAAVA